VGEASPALLGPDGSFSDCQSGIPRVRRQAKNQSGERGALIT
jgi:hypothetical protein